MISFSIWWYTLRDNIFPIILCSISSYWKDLDDDLRNLSKVWSFQTTKRCIIYRNIETFVKHITNLEVCAILNLNISIRQMILKFEYIIRSFETISMICSFVKTIDSAPDFTSKFVIYISFDSEFHDNFMRCHWHIVLL